MRIMLVRVFLWLTLVLCSLVVSQAAFAQVSDESCIGGGEDGAAINILADLPGGQSKPLAASYFLDSEGMVGAGSIASRDFAFAPCQEQFDIARAPGALWLKFIARNPHAEAQMWGISFMETVVDDLTLFQLQGGTLVQVAQDGRTIAAAQSDHNRLQTSVSFRIEPGQEEIYYVRVSGTYSPSVTPVIGSVNLLSDWSSGFSAISAVMLGFCVIMTLFSLILFRHVHSRFYQFYAAHLISLFFMTFLFDGWPHVLFGSTISTQQWKPLIELASGLVMIANIQYCRILLTIDIDPQKRKQSVFHWLTGIGVIATIWAMIDPLGWGTPVAILFIINPFVLLYVAGRKMLAGVKQAVPVFTSLVALSIGLFSSLYFFKFPVPITETNSAFDLIMMRPITLSYTSSTIVEATFMMIAISIMINAMQRQRNAAVTEAIKLRDQIDMSASHSGQAEKVLEAKDAALDGLLANDLDKKLTAPAEQGFLERATQSVIENVNQRGFGAGTLASTLGVTEKTLGRRLKKSQGLTPAAFIRSIRLSYARDLIAIRQFETVSEIADASGFSSASHFARLYRQEYKETPRETFK